MVFISSDSFILFLCMLKVITGYLLAGSLIGPGGFNFISEMVQVCISLQSFYLAFSYKENESCFGNESYVIAFSIHHYCQIIFSFFTI